MYKEWKIEIILKSGKGITVYYEGTEWHASAVAKKVLTGKDGCFKWFGDKTGAKLVYVRLGEIATISVSEA